METIQTEVRQGVASVSLNRPESHNALTPEMVQALTATFHHLAQAEEVRVVILTGRGRSFCAGADLSTMRAAADLTFTENVSDAEAIFDLMLAVDSCPKPVVGRINGAAIGGGAGLVSCCDVAVALDRARFGFSEVRLGLVPATISPFVLAKIGQSQARQFFLSGERFDAAQALRLGLVHYLADSEAALDQIVAERVNACLAAAPGAQAVAKKLVQDVAGQPRAAMRAMTAQVIAGRRASAEGREGMSAFLQKRQPAWQRPWEPQSGGGKGHE